MFGTVLSIVFTLMFARILWPIASTPFISRRAPRWVLAAIGLGIVAFFWISRTFAHDTTGALARAAETAAMTLLGAVFLIFVSVLAVDLVTGFGLLFRKRVASWRQWAVVAGVILSVIALVQAHRPPGVTSYEIRLAGLPPEADGTVLVAVSDTHLGNVLGADWLKARVAQVEQLKPDLVVLLGDIYEGHGRPAPDLLEPWRRLTPPLGMWFVTGNHETHRGGEGIDALLERVGIRVLHGKWAQLRPGLVLAGIDDLGRQHDTSDDPIARSLAGRPPGATILLSHTPLLMDRAAHAGVGLMLSGHTHGGQIWPFGYLLRFRYPVIAGLAKVDGMPLIVCRGTGTWGPRMRLWRRGEILRVTLRTL
jgi:hypothetical protein